MPRYVRIAPGYCWLEGDNDEDSSDSNVFGPVPLETVAWKAVTVFENFVIDNMVESEIPDGKKNTQCQ